MTQSILVVGSLNMDLVVRSPRHPQPGETLLGSDFQTFPGGKGANQAVTAARLGGQVRLLGRLGDDAFGDQLLANLAREGVDTSFILRTTNAATGVALITLDDAGQNTIVVAPGANYLLTPQDILDSKSAFENAAVVLIQLEIPLETVVCAVGLARQRNAKVLLNPAPARYLPPEFLEQVDYLLPNQSELALLTGIPGLEMATNAILPLVLAGVIVTLGGDGVFVAQEHGDTHKLPAFSIPVVDTVAAGDAFVGAFGLALAEGKDALDAAVFGNAAGALAVTRKGAQPSLPNRAELEQFLQDTNPF